MGIVITTNINGKILSRIWRLIMNDREKIKALRIILELIETIVVLIALTLQIFAYIPVRYAYLCIIIIALLFAKLYCDAVLEDKKRCKNDGIWLILWFGNWLLTLFIV